MTKLYYEALKHLPKRFCNEDTSTCEFKEQVLACNKHFKPISYNPVTKRWKAVKFLKHNHQIVMKI